MNERNKIIEHLKFYAEKGHLEFLMTGCEFIITVQGPDRNEIIAYLRFGAEKSGTVLKLLQARCVGAVAGILGTAA